MEKIDLISIPLSPRKDIDKIRVETALSLKDANPFYFVVGGAISRTYEMANSLVKKGVSEDRMRIVSGLDNYFLGFKELINESERIIEDRLREDNNYPVENPFFIGVATNRIGQERFNLYFDKAKKSSSLPPYNLVKKAIVSDEPREVLDLEKRALKKDKRSFMLGYTAGDVIKTKIHPTINSLYRFLRRKDPRELKR